MKFNKGISLITLVITIVVIIILTGAIVLSLSQNNPIAKANEARVKSDFATIQDSLNMAVSAAYANQTSPADVTVAIPTAYSSALGTLNGRLVYIGTDATQKAIAISAGLVDGQVDKLDGTKGVNVPQLPAGTNIFPVVWNSGTSTFDNTTIADTNWYDYTTQKWANMKTADGSYWVWIPRYAYKITSGYNSTTAGTIDVKFIKGISATAVDGTVCQISGPDNTKYVIPPAFWWDNNSNGIRESDGSEELLGIWVAKYEASNNGSGKVKIIPDATIWNNMTVATMFNNGRNMEITNADTTYGWTGATGGVSGIDTHMIKNSEWGATAYLAHSQYGRNGGQVWKNPYYSGSYITGKVGSTADPDPTTTVFDYKYAQGTPAKIQQSTTGNIYGVYDMSGGNSERVAAFMDNGNNSIKTYGGTTIFNSSNKLNDAYIKYWDKFAANESTASSTDWNLKRSQNYTTNLNVFGNALWEVSNPISPPTWNFRNGWFGSYTSMPLDQWPFMARGGEAATYGVENMFQYNEDSGDWYSNRSFRVSLIVAPGI